ncbi:SDR family oxidoreductase [Xinfangfangia sp. D13-10-4-6]|uniref:SDR family oxidoreductase n=1 Tax=Pseudogemmobacter hezensis TaxID=2737662 RepID=UPI001554A63A|nr:SDR family oxidoreductase [Pseudogemmobacter hezensis]NPD17649.1 SDR family oxidoreductase [Pseudogemmobacter hezensis]
MILISGATGQLGQEVVKHLLSQGAKGRFAVLARDANKAKPYSDQGIEVRIADFDAPDTLPAAFAGIETFLFISTMSQDRGPQQIKVVDAARAAGVKHVVYTGLAIHDIKTSGVRDLMSSHFETEDHIRASGMAWTFLRNTMYAEAIAQIAGPNALTDGIFLPGGDGRVPYALRAEMGEATANLLLQGGHAGKTYNITANQSWSYGDVAAALSRQTGRSLGYQNIPEDALREGMKAAGLPDFLIWLTLGTVQDIRNGQYEIESRDLQTLLGRAPKSVDEIVKTVFALPG